VTRRILYLQYTNPAAYPPLQHSALILAEQGWQVLFLGIAGAGAARLVMPRHQNIHNHTVGGRSGGMLAKPKYAAFALRSLMQALRFRPHWCYASDALSAPAARLIRSAVRSRMLYHEHDAPMAGESGLLLSARNGLAASADVVVAPAAERLARIPEGSGQRFVVWNCPRRAEAWQPAPPSSGDRFRIAYHGSLSRDRLTPQFITALAMLPPHVELHIYGYETVGHRGYAAELMERAQSAGVRDRVTWHGAIADRTTLLDCLRGHQLGIATVASGATDYNLHTLAGASNKAFEYLALGIPLLVSRAAAWQQLYRQPGYAVDCMPDDAESIAAAIRSLCDDAQRAHQMGEAGRARVLTEWNYEAQFAPVLRMLSA
jgi:glycosyltransferase involved in cell wall biosynthesis